MAKEANMKFPSSRNRLLVAAGLVILALGIGFWANRGGGSKPPPRVNALPAAAQASVAASGAVAQASAPAASAAPQAASAPQPPASQPAAAATPDTAASQAAAVAPATAASAPAPVVQTADPAPVASATPSKTYPVRAGDVLSLVFPKDWRKVCELSHLKDCNKIRKGDVLVLPEGVEPLEVKRPVREAKLKAERSTATPRLTLTPRVVSRVAREQACIRLGAQPFNPGHNPERTLQGIDALKTLTPAQKEIAKAKVQAGEKATANELVGQQIFKEMLYQDKHGKLIHVYDKPICSPDQGGEPEVMDTYDLGDGVQLSIPRRCGNPSVFIRPPVSRPAPEPPLTSAPEPEPEPRLEPKPEPEPQPTPTQPPDKEEEEQAYNYDRDLVFYAGLDRDVRFAGGEGAFYPGLFYYPWGRYAIGVGAFANFWQGATPEDYSFGGKYGALGLAQKLSTWGGQDLGFKFPMIGAFAEHGRNKPGFFQEHRDAKLWCAAVSYNDARREKRGERDLPEYVLWATYCDPFSQTKSRTVFGQSADTSTMSDIRYILSVGGRVYLSKDLTSLVGEGGLAKKLQPFCEIGLNKTHPNPFSAHAYCGLRTVNKVGGCGVGVHHSEAGTIAGATCTYDAGRHMYLNDKEERWAEMVKSLEALGVTVDD